MCLDYTGSIVSSSFISIFDCVVLHCKHSKNDPFDLSEMLQSLSQQEYEEMWSSLSKTCQQILTSFDMADEVRT